MRYYILPDQQGYKILKVNPEDIPLFQKRNAQDILCEADTLAELLLQFSQLLEKGSPSN